MSTISCFSQFLGEQPRECSQPGYGQGSWGWADSRKSGYVTKETKTSLFRRSCWSCMWNACNFTLSVLVCQKVHVSELYNKTGMIQVEYSQNLVSRLRFRCDQTPEHSSITSAAIPIWEAHSEELESLQAKRDKLSHAFHFLSINEDNTCMHSDQLRDSVLQKWLSFQSAVLKSCWVPIQPDVHQVMPAVKVETNS